MLLSSTLTNSRIIEAIGESSVLRVGYNPENMPFSYFGGIGELVGFDIDLAQILLYLSLVGLIVFFRSRSFK